MKQPSHCASLYEIRVELDRIDHQIVTLLAERFAYVHAAAPFKKSEVEVAAPERYTAMLAQRRDWAKESGLDADVVESVFREIVTYFIAREKELFRAGKGRDGAAAGQP
jgi:isochorismate pyruvate lyase